METLHVCHGDRNVRKLGAYRRPAACLLLTFKGPPVLCNFANIFYANKHSFFLQNIHLAAAMLRLNAATVHVPNVVMAVVCVQQYKIKVTVPTGQERRPRDRDWPVRIANLSRNITV